MKTAILRAPQRRLARTITRQRQLQRQLQRFDKRYRKPIAMLIGQHDAVADLAFSFPALLFALACPHKGLNRQAVLQAVAAGVPLKALAELAGIPLWLRKLPPEAFAQPIRKLPSDPSFKSQIGNCIPKPKQALEWLSCAYALAEIGHGPFVAWGLREALKEETTKWQKCNLRLLAVWSWYSLHGENAVADCTETRWQPNMTIGKAVEVAGRWRTDLRRKLTARESSITDFWFEPARIAGFDFEPFTDYVQIRHEAKRMKNCLAGYTVSVAEDRCRLWKVVRDGKTEAVLEITDGYGLQLLAVNELRGPENDDVSLEIAKAVRRWQNLQPEERLLPRKSKEDDAPLQDVWVAMWKPYWLHMRKVPHWLSAKGNWDAFEGLSSSSALW
jgi:hypothetical protein